jgi:hypothetical protein
VSERNTERLEDDLLRGAFAALRAETGAPEFEAVLDRARADLIAAPRLDVEAGGSSDVRAHSRGRTLRIGGWASAAVAATVAALLLTDGWADADAEFEALVASYSADVTAGGWRSPTSSLLDVPGMELVRTLPSIGAPARGLDPATRPPSLDEPGRDS